MSRRATLVSALSFVALILSRSMVAQQRDNSRPSDMATSIAVTTSSPSLDLVLISPQDPSFDGVTRTLLGVAASGPALDLKPFLAVLSNRSSGTVVAYEMFWNVTNTDKTGENRSRLRNSARPVQTLYSGYSQLARYHFL
jgi:hypothetical protein